MGFNIPDHVVFWKNINLEGMQDQDLKSFLTRLIEPASYHYDHTVKDYVWTGSPFKAKTELLNKRHVYTRMRGGELNTNVDPPIDLEELKADLSKSHYWQQWGYPERVVVQKLDGTEYSVYVPQGASGDASYFKGLAHVRGKTYREISPREAELEAPLKAVISPIEKKNE